MNVAAQDLAEPTLLSPVDRLIFLPYRLIRPPLAVIDEHAIKRLPSGNPVRELYHAGLRLADGIARVDRPHPAATDEPTDQFDDSDIGEDAADDTTDAELAQADEQRRKDFAKKEEQITRGNRSPATMARELAQARAAEEAREHEAAESKTGEPVD
jgi:hypothetical protein